MPAGEQHNFFGESVFRGILLKCNGSSCVSFRKAFSCEMGNTIDVNSIESF
jgi:hypothetical protein